jgi:hypothetical protein
MHQHAQHNKLAKRQLLPTANFCRRLGSYMLTGDRRRHWRTATVDHIDRESEGVAKRSCVAKGSGGFPMNLAKTKQCFIYVLGLNVGFAGASGALAQEAGITIEPVDRHSCGALSNKIANV